MICVPSLDLRVYFLPKFGLIKGRVLRPTAAHPHHILGECPIPPPYIHDIPVCGKYNISTCFMVEFVLLILLTLLNNPHA